MRECMEGTTITIEGAGGLWRTFGEKKTSLVAQLKADDVSDLCGMEGERMC